MKLIDGIPVIVPEKIKEYEYEYLVVSVIDDKIYKDIIIEAESMGIRREIIVVWSKCNKSYSRQYIGKIYIIFLSTGYDYK